MKHIKATAKLSEDQTEVLLSVTDQSHRGIEFGPIRLGTGEEASGFEHDGMLLSSYGGVRFYHNYKLWYENKSNNVLSVRGRFGERDTEVAIIPIDMWAKLKATLNAYNEWGKTQ